MKALSLNIKLLVTFALLLAGTIIANDLFLDKDKLEQSEVMHSAVQLTKEWFSILGDYKSEHNIISDAGSTVQNKFMIGEEWTEITSTLGPLEVKETSTNPDFAALIVRWLNEAHIVKGQSVGLIASGSFPSLIVSTLAALQTLEIDVWLMSSLGASTYGANQPDFTLIDMERILAENGDLSYKSGLVSRGAGNDKGFGLSGEGLDIMKKAAQRNAVSLYIPGSLVESINYRVELLREKDISLLINIGGNEAAMGSCPHSYSIPNGLNSEMQRCKHDNRGVISRMNEMGIPFIHLLNIKEIALQYGIDIEPGEKYAKSENLYTLTATNRPGIAIILIICLVPLFFLGKES